MVKHVTTIMAAITAMALIGFGMYGFVHDLHAWGAPMIAGMFAGGVTLAVAHNL